MNRLTPWDNNEEKLNIVSSNEDLDDYFKLMHLSYTYKLTFKNKWYYEDLL